ncbi:hypothetical protein [Ferrimonas balearica]|uniref:hypothetical protein n=1 Tax=Ferrimonas balearica TaxID=44012 RepID=UPI001C596832|nr:hypothetical protein [Ferrimonas balearica]MBW3139194.1 hypothetical protein [Ferrimonas balearica]MBY6094939.1 hypothetical protein [Ferrimonas balearica]MBY6106256.1 hypothetical protein [Ferrimonas balearica]MBY6223164.1 hypothetical protein [Ferrimonas balearica]
MPRRLAFELTIAMSLMLMGGALATAHISDWSLAITGAVLMGTSLVLRPRSQAQTAAQTATMER